MTKGIAVLVALAMATPAAAGTLAPDVQAALSGLAAGGKLGVVVHLKDRADLGAIKGDRASRLRATIQALRDKADSTQGPIRTWLQARQGSGGVNRFTPLWVVNGFSLTATGPVIRLVAALPAVEVVNLDAIPVVATGIPPGGAPRRTSPPRGRPDLWSPRTSRARASSSPRSTAAWTCATRTWRRGTGAARDSWFDPYGQHATPLRPPRPRDLDPGGHPRAEMRAGRLDRRRPAVPPGSPPGSGTTPGSATATAIHLAFQWVLDPDGDPNTADAPDIVNNSWAFGDAGMQPRFQSDLQALRAAGIVPVVAAGQLRPGSPDEREPGELPGGALGGLRQRPGTSSPRQQPRSVGLRRRHLSRRRRPGRERLDAEPLLDLYASGVRHVHRRTARLRRRWRSCWGVPGVQRRAGGGGRHRSRRATSACAGPDNDFGQRHRRRAWPHTGLLATAPSPAPIAVADAFTVPGDVATTVTAPGILANDQTRAASALGLADVRPDRRRRSPFSLPADSPTRRPPDSAGRTRFGYRVSSGTAESEAAIVTLTVMTAAPTPQPGRATWSPRTARSPCRPPASLETTPIRPGCRSPRSWWLHRFMARSRSRRAEASPYVPQPNYARSGLHSRTGRRTMEPGERPGDRLAHRDVR